MLIRRAAFFRPGEPDRRRRNKKKSSGDVTRFRYIGEIVTSAFFSVTSTANRNRFPHLADVREEELMRSDGKCGRQKKL